MAAISRSKLAVDSHVSGDFSAGLRTRLLAAVMLLFITFAILLPAFLIIVLLVQEANVVVKHMQSGDAERTLYLARSPDGGKTFEPPAPFRKVPNPNGRGLYSPTIATPAAGSIRSSMPSAQ